MLQFANKNEGPIPRFFVKKLFLKISEKILKIQGIFKKIL